MAKKRRKKQAKPAATPAPKPPVEVTPEPAPAPPAPPPPEPVKEPAFWFGFEVTWRKLLIARVVVFGLLALDAVLQVRHAPRYWAGDFNVGQLPLFDELAPGRAGYEVSQLVLAYLLVMAA